MRVSSFLLISFLGSISLGIAAQTNPGAERGEIDGYGLKLESTVGLGPACADSSNLTLPLGTHEVTVCLRATNASDNTLYLHDIVAERLGHLVDAQLYTLPGNESIFYTYTLGLDRSAALVSRWTAYGDRGIVACAVAWSLVLIQGRAQQQDIPFDTTLVCPQPVHD
jgi:hypothetical protein